MSYAICCPSSYCYTYNYYSSCCYDYRGYCSSSSYYECVYTYYYSSYTTTSCPSSYTSTAATNSSTIIGIIVGSTLGIFCCIAITIGLIIFFVRRNAIAALQRAQAQNNIDQTTNIWAQSNIGQPKYGQPFYNPNQPFNQGFGIQQSPVYGQPPIYGQPNYSQQPPIYGQQPYGQPYQAY